MVMKPCKAEELAEHIVAIVRMNQNDIDCINDIADMIRLWIRNGYKEENPD